MTDVYLRDCGSIIQFKPETDDAKEFIDTYVNAEEWQWMGGWLCVDRRPAAELIGGMQAHGLALSF